MSVTFACYFPAENPLFIPIEIKSDAWVAQMQGAVALELKANGQKVRPRDLRLFKTDVPLEPEETLQPRALQWLHQQPANGGLKMTTKLSLVFPHGPHQSDDNMKLDIIVADAEVLEMIDGLGDPYDAYNRKVKKDLNKRLNNLSLYPSPSEIIGSANKLLEAFGGDEPNIHLGRPGGAPAVIFNPALAALQQRLDHLEQIAVSRQEVDRAANYLRCAVKFCKDEEERQDLIKDLVDRAIGRAGEWGCPVDCATSKIKPDSCWWHDVFLVLVLELKNMLGLSGDAIYQAIIDYIKIVSRDKYKRFREYCNFPIVLVGITANRLEISVAVCIGPVYVTKLLMLDLSLGFHASDNIIRLARVFTALSRCRADLETYYHGVGSLVSPRLSCLFPNPTPVNLSKPLPKLTYRQFLSRTGQPTSTLVDLKNATTTMYVATLGDTNQEVIVKFTARYNEAAHRLLAEAQLAPTLHFCGRIVGDLYMIVMDRVDGTSVWQLQQDKTPIPAIVPKKVEEAVRLLHERDTVFGDLRSNNILYVASKDHVLLVDFDWPGKDGESRYPATLNLGTDGKTWDEDVLPYSIMRKAHDLWQLDWLKDLCSRANV